MMKMIREMGIALCMLIAGSLYCRAQVPSSTKQGTIRPEQLLLTYAKTTNLVFPYPIKSVDKGSKDILVQLAKGVENILQVKAAKQGFEETNLSVITADGKLYSFVANYTSAPVELNIRLGINNNYPKADALFTFKSDNEAKVYDITEQISSKKPIIKNLRDSRYDVSMNLFGVYIKEDRLYFQFGLSNNSNVDYEVDDLRFFISDVKRSKRTSFQEVELQPLEVVGNKEIVRGQSRQNLVVALSKFTIPEKQVLLIKLMERNGGRHLQLKIKNRLIIKAESIK